MQGWLDFCSLPNTLGIKLNKMATLVFHQIFFSGNAQETPCWIRVAEIGEEARYFLVPLFEAQCTYNLLTLRQLTSCRGTRVKIWAFEYLLLWTLSTLTQWEAWEKYSRCSKRTTIGFGYLISRHFLVLHIFKGGLLPLVSATTQLFIIEIPEQMNNYVQQLRGRAFFIPTCLPSFRPTYSNRTFSWKSLIRLTCSMNSSSSSDFITFVV